MSEIEHPFAIYFDENGVRRRISAEELADRDKLAEAKQLDLWDESEQFRVVPKISVLARPFFSAIGQGAYNVYRGEKNPEHDDRVSDLLSALKALPAWSITLKGRKSDRPVLEKVVYSKLPTYQWGSEVHRILDEKTIVRHDIFGQSGDLGMSINRPWVAIEVINTHYPEPTMFSNLLETTKRVPLIVFFDFTEFDNAFLKVDFVKKSLIYHPWTYLIRNGSVWKGEAKRNLIDSATKFELETESTLKGFRKKR